MNHQRTLARPYARAVFELAIEQNTLTHWANVLQVLACIGSDARVQQIYNDPRQSRQRLVEEIYAIVQQAGYDDAQVRHFLQLLNNYRRLLLLPVIAELFAEARTQHEKMLSLTVTSAFPLAEAIRNRLQQALKKRLQRAVTIDYQLDPALLGGAIVRAGDLVIDGSVKSQLLKLKYAIVHA